ncbi:MAG: sigma-70 family RNA polymerase sigma factor [Bdellovibrionales bacterium]|nr:sigma-70 family RNA polymerase sigma factor [Bdellovibrionales bacterium]
MNWLKPRASELAQRKKWFHEVLKENQGALLRFAHSLVSDTELAQDIVQEAFTRLWDRAPDDVEGYVVEWLFKVCRNLSIDHLRKEKRMDNKALNLDCLEDLDQLDVESQLDKKSRQQIVAEVISQLKPHQQEVLRMKFEKDFSYHKISDVTGYSVTHVGVLIHNTIKAIRKKMIQRLQLDIGDAAQDE